MPLAGSFLYSLFFINVFVYIVEVYGRRHMYTKFSILIFTLKKNKYKNVTLNSPSCIKNVFYIIVKDKLSFLFF